MTGGHGWPGACSPQERSAQGEMNSRLSFDSLPLGYAQSDEMLPMAASVTALVAQAQPAEPLARTPGAVGIWPSSALPSASS